MGIFRPLIISVCWFFLVCDRNSSCPTLGSLDWLQPNFKDYPVYLAKFKQCLSKAMHFMKIHIVNTMQNLTSQLTKRVSSRPFSSSTPHTVCLLQRQYFIILSLLLLLQDPMSLTNADNAFTLYYVKFRAAAPKVRVSMTFSEPTEIASCHPMTRFDFVFLPVTDRTDRAADREDPRVSLCFCPDRSSSLWPARS